MTARLAIPRVLRERGDALAGAVSRLRGREPSAYAPAGVGGPRGATAAAQPGPRVGPGELYERRDALALQLAELQWDLGGLAYEMAIRDHFRVDVLVRVAAQLQAVDAELAEIERLLRLDEAGAAGACPSCAALHARAAAFCWRCGAALLDDVRVTPTAPGTPGTAPERSA